MVGETDYLYQVSGEPQDIFTKNISSQASVDSEVPLHTGTMRGAV